MALLGGVFLIVRGAKIKVAVGEMQTMARDGLNHGR